MKTKITQILPPVIILLFFLMQAGPLIAIEPTATCAEKLKDKLKESVKYPHSGRELSLQGEVMVIFTVSGEGAVNVCHISGTSGDLVHYVKDLLPTIRCKELKDAAGKFFKVRFNFKLV